MMLLPAFTFNLLLFSAVSLLLSPLSLSSLIFVVVYIVCCTFAGVLGRLCFFGGSGGVLCCVWCLWVCVGVGVGSGAARDIIKYCIRVIALGEFLLRC